MKFCVIGPTDLKLNCTNCTNIIL